MSFFFSNFYVLLDYWVDTRCEDTHPLATLEMKMHCNPYLYNMEQQIQYLGNDHLNEALITNNIGITPGVGIRVPRHYTRDGVPSRERGKAFLNYLKHSGVGSMAPKHTAIYFYDENSEPLGHVLPPIQVKRKILNQYIKMYHKFQTNREHTCGHEEEEKTHKKPRICNFNEAKENFVKQAGHNAKIIPFEVIGHMSPKPFVTKVDKFVDVQGNIEMDDVDAVRLSFCFHRKRHSCQRCCALEPTQELFAAHSTDFQQVVRLLSSNTYYIFC